ncbi:hypothetical protein DFH28DRAFT_1143628 [Melampsora americana]|nr:hypothetical protein DFH28DRAFT_1143628 [Melampsora americana]
MWRTILVNHLVHLDLTQSPSPTSRLTPISAPAPASPSLEQKPNRLSLWFRVFILNPLTDAEKQSGTPQTYADYEPPFPFNVLLHVHGVSLEDLKKNLFAACDRHKRACGQLLKIANDHGQLAIKGFVCGGGPFGKSAPPLIPNEASFDLFKATMLERKGKEIGFRLIMDNPKRKARTTSKVMSFDQALAVHHPNALDSDQTDELEMAVIGVVPTHQSYLTQLLKKYSNMSIGGKQCMGCINPRDPTMAMHLTHAMLDIWAEDLLNKKPDVTIVTPPTREGFTWLPIKSKSNVQSNTITTTTNPNIQPPQRQSDSPAPRPLPPLEEYLDFCSIRSDNHETRILLKQHDVVNFEMFLSPNFDFEKMQVLGYGIGASVRLHDNAPVYRQFLKDKLKPSF